MYTIQNIATILQANLLLQNETNSLIEHLCTDSRKISFAANSLFFAITTSQRTGNQFIEDAYQQGVTNFVVSQNYPIPPHVNANFITVKNTLEALQTLAAYHRKQFNIPVIGITGSNGKTIVKEWLFDLLKDDFNIVRSPRSYNSQIGVPLSVWGIQPQHNLAIFEAGISTVEEMDNLEKIIAPSIGVLTNIGSAHDDGFANKTQKFIQKTKLFDNAGTIVSAASELYNVQLVEGFKNKNIITIGNGSLCNFIISSIQITKANHSIVTANYQQKNISLTIPFADEASVQNCCICWAVLLHLGFEQNVIQQKINALEKTDMHLKLQPAVNGCVVINDTYTNDINAFISGVDFLCNNAQQKDTTVILSEFLGIKPEHENKIYEKVMAILKLKNIKHFIGIGVAFEKRINEFNQLNISVKTYASVKEFLQKSSLQYFKQQAIYIKGSKQLGFHKITKWLQQKKHHTVMEVNLSALVHNLNQYKKQLQPTTKIMAMVKAFSYGSGSEEVARVLQYNKVDYLTVAYTDEGVQLRKTGISLPIMVMNVNEDDFYDLIDYSLEPEVYSMTLLQQLLAFLQQQGINYFSVHIKINTGMNRLGFDEQEVKALANILSQQQHIIVKSVFTHLAGSDDEALDAFTQQQINLFTLASNTLQQSLGYSFLQHAANTAAAARLPQIQFNMVRLGIGLYGVNNSNNKQLNLQPVTTLKTTIAQIRNLPANTSVGYNRKSVVDIPSTIATIRIGYADGLSRSLSNGKGFVYINGKLAPIIGNVCMDMTMINITHISNVQEGDEVEIFGTHLPVTQVAEWSNTIAYETLSGITQRVKRVYVQE